jgi:hypothetical protein
LSEIFFLRTYFTDKSARERVVFALCTLFIIAYSLRLIYHLLGGNDHHLTLLEDDFFYYYIIAKHIVHEGRSTFDTITLTNGYHPLWMIVLVILEVLSFGSASVFFVLLSIVFCASAFFSFRFLSKLASIFPNGLYLTDAGLVFGFLFALRLIVTGLEAVMVVPLYLYFFLRLQKLFASRDNVRKDFLVFGLVASLLVLSRIDTAILVGLTFVFVMYKERERLAVPFAGLFIGSIPIIIYLATNLIYFGHLQTVSSAAKMMKDHIGLSTNTLSFFLSTPNGKAITAVLVPGFIALLFYRKIFSGITQRTIVFLSMGSSLIIVVVFSLLSDWLMFVWYWYFIPFAALLSFYMIEQIWLRISDSQISKVGQIVVASVVVIGVVYRSASFWVETTVNWKPDSYYIYTHAKEIAKFGETHKGVYAMGDMSGLTSYLLNQPLLQTEGLCADFKMLDHIRHRDDLPTVLKEYGVDYYVTNVSEGRLPKQNGCYLATEPHPIQAGDASPMMSGLFCSEPLLTFPALDPDSTKPVAYSPTYTYIFSLKPKN